MGKTKEEKTGFITDIGVTTLVIDQNSSGVKVRYMMSLYTNLEAQTIPNSYTARYKMQC